MSSSREERNSALLWYCIHSKPKCEHLVAASLKAFEGVEAYCPRIRFQRSTQRGKVWFTEALFPSYLFARFVMNESFRAVKHAHNVIRIVEFGGEPSPVPDETIEALKKEMRGLEVREVTHGLKIGETVEVAEGPMRGLTGIVENIASGDERVYLLLDFLGRQSVVQMPASNVISDRGPREAMMK
jgi:transcription elongation factor/antiterminator RfaH